MSRRPRNEAQATRQNILDAATQRFAQEGYAAASLSAIVEDAGITKGALFHHFENKKDLFRQVWQSLQERMDSEAQRAANAVMTSDDPYTALLAGAKVYLNWTGNPAYQRIILLDGPVVLGELGSYEAATESGAKNVRRGLRYIAKHGPIPSEFVEPYALLLQNALNGAGMAVSRGYDGLTTDQIYEAFERMLRSLR